MYKKYKRLVYTPSDLLARIFKVSRPNLLWSRAIMALECNRRCLLFLGVHIFRLSTRCKMFHSKIMHQSIPPAPSPLQVDPRALAFFLPWMANSRVWGLLSCQSPGWGRKKGQIPRPPSTLQHFSLIAQSNSSILSILMCDFLFQSTSSFVIALGF